MFVGEDGTWKLGGVEFLCRFDQASMSYLAKCKGLRDEMSLTPEEKVIREFLCYLYNPITGLEINVAVVANANKSQVFATDLKSQ